jgi:predicted transcriptional regulator
MPEKPIIGIRLDPEDVELLDAMAAKEERSRSDVVRRAIRAYAKELGVAPKTKSRAGKK